jgi:hypothetical protein
VLLLLLCVGGRAWLRCCLPIEPRTNSSLSSFVSARPTLHRSSPHCKESGHLPSPRPVSEASGGTANQLAGRRRVFVDRSESMIAAIIRGGDRILDGPILIAVAMDDGQHHGILFAHKQRTMARQLYLSIGPFWYSAAVQYVVVGHRLAQ